jgi:acyl CoA:acetate/3-ketoacid CoA transferase
MKIVKEGRVKKFVRQLANVDYNALEGMRRGQDVKYYTGDTLYCRCRHFSIPDIL